MSTTHAGAIQVTYEALARLLELQENAQITGVCQSPGDRLHEQFGIIVLHPDLPEVREGCEIPQVDIETIQEKQP